MKNKKSGSILYKIQLKRKRNKKISKKEKEDEHYEIINLYAVTSTLRHPLEDCD